MSLTTAPTFGLIPSCFVWMSKGNRPPLRAFHPIISARPDNFGETLFIDGTSLRLPATDGGLSAAAHPLQMFDMVRLDHFRGFEAYWEVPAGASTAAEGKWVKGPGAELFRALQTALKELPFVAENLGVITPGGRGSSQGVWFPRHEPSAVCLRKRSARPQLSPAQLFS